MIFDGITRRQVKELAATARDPAITIYVPTSRTGPEVMQGRIKLRNLLVEAENQLVERGMRRTLALDLLKPAAELGNDTEFWNDRLDSVAFFISPGVFQAFHLPFGIPEYLEVGTRFHVRPLLPILNCCLAYYVLALERSRVRLVHCGPRGAAEVPVKDMPTSLEAFVSLDYADKQLQYHTAGHPGRAGSVIGHGAGDKGVDDKERLTRFSIAIARAVERHLASSVEPVVLAGTAEFQDTFRASTVLPRLLDDGITTSPKMFDADGLRAEAEPIVARFADTPRKASIAHYREMAGTGYTSQQLDQILTAAKQGKVDVLFAQRDSMVWGRHDASSGSIAIDNEPLAGDEELINEAAIATVDNGGVVYTVEPDELPLEDPVAAILRY